jgi:cobaltochelatase CobN
VKSIRKQVILLVTTFVFALVLCGAVAAENTAQKEVTQSDSDMNNSTPSENTSLKQNIISGQVLDCVTNKPFPNVTVTAKNNGKFLTSTVTDAAGKYELRFQSNSTVFNITASYPNHKPSATVVNTILQSNGNKTTYTAKTNFKLGKPKVLFLLGGLGGTSDIYPALIDAINNRHDIESTIVRKNAIPAGLNFKNFDLIFVDAIWPSTPNYENLKALLQDAMAHNVIVANRAPYNIPWQEVGNVNMTVHAWIPTYWTNTNQYKTSTSVHNMNNLIDYLCVKFLGLTSINTGGNPKAPITLPKEGIYHPDASSYFTNLNSYLSWYKYNSSKPTVALCIGQTVYNNLDSAVVDKLIRAFEALGYNVVPYFYDHEGTAQGEPKVDTYLIKNGKCIADLIIHYRAAGWNTVLPSEDVITELERLNVPIIKALTYSGSYEAWMNSTTGLTQDSFAYTISNMEIQGIFDPIVIAVQEKNSAGVTVNVPIQRQINWMVNRVKALINLKYKPNSDKKVAIIYWSSTGKDKGAGASHLDVYASIPEILKALKNSGYNLGSQALPSISKLVEMTRNQGLNVGLWAPGELKKLVENYPVVLVPEKEYLTWFNSLNAAKRQEVIDMWGEPPGDIMMYQKDGKKYLVLPVIQFGNVIIAPEPSRGYNQDQEALYHSGTVPPNHQYLAFYFWLKKGFHADAVIDFGRHGTVAWLPGKSATGLDCENDWPAIITQDIPVIYLFTVEGSESTLPKRRQNAIIISHMIPPMTISGLYGDLAALDSKIHEYESTTDESVRAEYRKSIIQLVKSLRLDEDIGINMNTASKDFEGFLEKIHPYLHELESQFITNGLHILGQAPTGDKLVYMVQSLLGYDFREYMEIHNLTDQQVKKLLDKVLIENKTPEVAQKSVLGSVSSEMTNYLNLAIKYRDYLDECTQEIDSTLKALNGKYITPGGMGDPIINPSVLPTGKNIYSFDPRVMPTEEAWNVGVKLAQEMINRYMKEKGEYPKKIAFMLWATHTIQDKGVMEAQILYLLGIELVRDPDSGYVTDVKLVENLGRPRIDVLITTTALYLNDYKYTLNILDKAVRLAATTNDTAYPNYVKENAEAIYQALRKLGYSEEDARKASTSRIFSQEPGNHHNPLEDAISMGSTWDSEEKLANSYIETFGNAFGMDGNSVHMSDLYRLNLADSQVAVFRRYVNANDLLSGDDYSAYFGGLGMSIRSVSGKDPLMWITNLENPNNPHIESLSESLAKDVRTTYYNPKWIQAMQGHGASGAGKITSFVENMYMWDVTSPNSVTNGMWDDAYSIYVKDKYNLGLKQWFDKSNPYAAQAMYAKMMEAARKNYWQTTDAIKQDLANRWAESIIRNGVSCCDCSCGNLAMMEWATQYINPDLLAQFKSQMYAATSNPSFAPNPNTENPSNPESPSNPANPNQPEQPSQQEQQGSSASTNPGEQQVSAASTPGEEGDQEKAYEISETNQQSQSQNTGMPIAAIVGVVLIVGFIGVGYFKTNILNFLKK